jgi:hypothetical protein
LLNIFRLKFSLFVNYGALNSKPVFSAFKTGIEQHGHSFVLNEMDADVAVIWSMLWSGRMKPNKQVWEHYRNKNKPVIILEVGALDRNNLWKIAINSIDNTGYFGPTNNSNSRKNKLKLFEKPWRQSQNIIIACQNSNSYLWSNMLSQDTWLNNTINEIKKFTDRSIIIRPHPRFPVNIKRSDVIVQSPRKISNTYDSYDFEESLKSAWALINYNSNPAIISAINGIPVFVDKTSLAFPVGNISFSNINNPQMPDRTQWLNDIAYTEWTLEEIESGEPLNRILNFLINH